MLIYRRADTLEVVGYSDLDYASCMDDKKIHLWLYLYDDWRSCFVEKC